MIPVHALAVGLVGLLIGMAVLLAVGSLSWLWGFLFGHDDQPDLAGDDQPAPNRPWRPDTTAAMRQAIEIGNSWTELDELQYRRALRGA